MIPTYDHTGPYIWAAYGFAAFVLFALTLGVLIRGRRAQARLERLERETEEE